MEYDPAEYTSRQLKAIARDQGIPGYSSMTKAQLSQALNELARINEVDQIDEDQIDKVNIDVYNVLDVNTLMQIALNIPDRYLTAFCQINSRTGTVCQSDLFWRERFDKRINSLENIPNSKGKDLNKVDWKKAYRRLLKQARSGKIKREKGGNFILEYMPKIDELYVKSVPYKYLRSLPNLKYLRLKDPIRSNNYALPSSLEELRFELTDSFSSDIPRDLLNVNLPNLVLLDLPKRYQNLFYIENTPDTIIFRDYQEKVKLREGVKRLIYMNGLNLKEWKNIPNSVVELSILNTDNDEPLVVTDDDLPKSLQKLDVPSYVNINFLTGAAYRYGQDRLFKEVEGPDEHQTYLEYTGTDQWDIQEQDSFE